MIISIDHVAAARAKQRGKQQRRAKSSRWPRLEKAEAIEGGGIGWTVGRGNQPMDRS